MTMQKKYKTAFKIESPNLVAEEFGTILSMSWFTGICICLEKGTNQITTLFLGTNYVSQ